MQQDTTMFGVAKSRVAHASAHCPRARQAVPLPALREHDRVMRRMCKYCAMLDEGCLVCGDMVGPGARVSTGCHVLCVECEAEHVRLLRQNPRWDGGVSCPCSDNATVFRKVAFSSTEGRTVSETRDIIDDALTLRCPHCATAFVDFDGCAAIECRCRGAFCALCLTACTDMRTAHVHVRGCSFNPEGDYYVSTSTWDAAMRTRKMRRAWSAITDACRDRGPCFGLHIGLELMRAGAPLSPTLTRTVVSVCATTAFAFFFPIIVLVVLCNM